MKFDQQERIALKRAGFAIADDHAAAYLDSLVVIDAHDDETFWLTVTLPNDTRIVCVLPRPRDHRGNRAGRLTRRTEGGMRGLMSGKSSGRDG